MKITPRGGTAITLVDPAVGSFQPIPAVAYLQQIGEYHIVGGQSHSYALGGAQPDISPAVVLIDQIDDATAATVLLSLKTAILDDTKQPMAVQWDDNNGSGPFDGNYFLSLTSPEVSTDFPGRIRLTLTMRPDA